MTTGEVKVRVKIMNLCSALETLSLKRSDMALV